MKRLTFAACLAILLVANLHAQQQPETKKVTVDELIRMINYVREQPFSPGAQEMFPLIMQVAMTSDLVFIEVSDEKLPWLAPIESEPWARYLLGGYVAGDMEYQLENGVKEDNPQAGFRFALSIYRKLKAVNPDIQVEAFESAGL